MHLSAKTTTTTAPVSDVRVDERTEEYHNIKQIILLFFYMLCVLLRVCQFPDIVVVDP